MPTLAAAAMRAERRAERRRQQQEREEGGGGRGGGMDVDGAEVEGEGGDGDGDGADDVWAGDAELGAHPPTSQALRLHAVLARRVAPREPPPRAPASLKPEELRASLGALRGAALRVLSGALGGDELAAEYVLAAALGCVHKRVDGTPHGHVHLNLTCAADSGEGPAPGRARRACGPLLCSSMAFAVPG
jgi:hypothetical protein